MNSDQLNSAIAALDDLPNAEELRSRDKMEKIVPYIGWFWRRVDFNAPTYSFGIIPTGTPEYTMSDGNGNETHGPRSASPCVGFMENNKWDYPYTRDTTPDEWTEIKRLLVELCEHPTPENADAVRAKINAIAAPTTPPGEKGAGG